MKYEDIVKGLKCCVVSGKCRECPYNEDVEDVDECCNRMIRDAIALVEGQRDEIEWLKAEGGVRA